MENKKQKKIAPILCAGIIIVALGIFLATILFPLMGDAFGHIIAIGVLLIYGGALVAVIVGVIVALRQRLKEIESGEEEEAKKY